MWFTMIDMVNICFLFFLNDTATTEIYPLSLHDALPIYACVFERGREPCEQSEFVSIGAVSVQENDGRRRPFLRHGEGSCQTETIERPEVHIDLLDHHSPFRPKDSDAGVCHSQRHHGSPEFTQSPLGVAN